jgi:hypothetical protein
MNWDERGRLWVIETVDYPNEIKDDDVGDDRIKILEDTNGDGKADKITIFADKLNIPTSFTFSNGGIIVSEAPSFLFLKDTDGDDKADIMHPVLTGWGKRDTHRPQISAMALIIRSGEWLGTQDFIMAKKVEIHWHLEVVFTALARMAKTWNFFLQQVIIPGAWVFLKSLMYSFQLPIIRIADSSECRKDILTKQRLPKAALRKLMRIMVCMSLLKT